ncbi:unnamed protein product [Leptidea sinapis]|uniref:Uncharacterized protein n=1 Tax=Leptidea sinapis TaxID=189913 RepID=A0A5E4Q480_9NEOP|nr:unnamed protein product [Leptidea sinapis]
MNLPEIKSYEEEAVDTVVSIGSSTLKCPLIKNSEMLIKNAIEKNWLLTETLLYTLNYKGKSQDETQPTVAYPIPQETASVFFRMTFRIEGHYRDHDVRFIRLSPDWILGVLKMKAKLFSRVEEIGLF